MNETSSVPITEVCLYSVFTHIGWDQNSLRNFKPQADTHKHNQSTEAICWTNRDIDDCWLSHKWDSCYYYVCNDLSQKPSSEQPKYRWFYQPHNIYLYLFLTSLSNIPLRFYRSTFGYTTLSRKQTDYSINAVFPNSAAKTSIMRKV